VRRVSRVDVEVAHDLPFHEDVREVNGRKQSAGALERMMLGALNVDLHDRLTEGHDVDEIIKYDGVDDDWTTSSAFADLHQTHIHQARLCDLLVEVWENAQYFQNGKCEEIILK